jgi:UDP-N-acetylmuramoyl-L-alanyl-D-glutamate--2,6-diaminopimelate ligase
MHNLATLLRDLKIAFTGSIPPQLAIEKVTDDSREAGPGVLFVAIPGVHADGHAFLPDAARRGCTVALVSNNCAAPAGMQLIRIAEPRRALPILAEYLAGQPSRAMAVFGITGTNGKTTTTYLLESIFRAAGWPAGVLGTIDYRWDSPTGPVSIVANNTTPSPVVISNTLARMRADGVRGVAMEVSSHALDQFRADGIRFTAAGFTNLTQDHLDYHTTMDAYQSAKQRLFTELLGATGVAVLNNDDLIGRQFASACKAQHVVRYSLMQSRADIFVRRILHRPPCMLMDIMAFGKPLRVETPMPGLYNAQNCLLAIGMTLGIGLPVEAIQAGVLNMTGAPGRFEFVHAGQPFPIIIDYAHTPDALLQLLLQARGFAHRKLITIFGCGGDRDPGKRPLMGEAAARLSDEIIVTNDNPRTENPDLIAAAIMEGVQRAPLAYTVKCELELDRRAAIRRAIGRADPKDAVVIAGKGHENYQIFGVTKTHFDDREEAAAAVGALGA